MSRADMNNKPVKKRTIAIISTCQEDWGGSEELWAKSIPHLQKFGYQIKVIKNNINFKHPAFLSLRQRQVELIELYPPASQLRKYASRIQAKVKRTLNNSNYSLFKSLKEEEPWTTQLKKLKPDFVIVGQGINFDGLFYAIQCARLSVPYVIIAQKAVDFYWPLPSDRMYMTEALERAERAFFVSNHNLRLTEEQFGIRLKNAKVVFNPVKVSGEVIPFPSTQEGYKLACVGRLFLLDKGQDIIIRILSEKKWRERPVTVSFIGTGVDFEGLKAMAALLGVKNVVFKGHVEDIESLWKDYHALVLPSRSEGLPLSMVEAMAAGRPVIVAKSGGNAEIIEEGITGFVGHANEESFGDAMERAWNSREKWPTIGITASKSISTVFPKSPELEFAKEINGIINK